MYTFPSGGAYAGEWRGGQRVGLGARSYSLESGRAPATGRWQEDRLQEPLPPRDVDTAVQGALDAAAAAREAGAVLRYIQLLHLLC